MKRITVLLVVLLAAAAVQNARAANLLGLLMTGDKYTIVDTVKFGYTGLPVVTIATPGFIAQRDTIPTDTFDFGERRWPDRYAIVSYVYNMTRMTSLTLAPMTQDSWYELADPPGGGERSKIKFKFPEAVGERPNRPVTRPVLSAEPNPFEGRTTLSYGISAPAHVRVQVFDMTGQVVATLLDEQSEAGSYQFTWNGRDNSGREVSQGVYLARIAAGSERFLTKLVKTE